MSGLGARDFPAFFRAVFAVDPFPWQTRLADLVCAEGWPTALDVPTGAGKTAAIDVAIFHLATEAARGAARRAACRIAFVVDRRLVVDDAYARAKKIEHALTHASDGVLGDVAASLRTLGGDVPLVCARLRGGVPKEPDWARTPAQPTVLVSTVDQVGSRMLFRGYGISRSMRPVHAGLLGADALLLLDEAHLSQPFVETARARDLFQKDLAWCDSTVQAPFSVCTLSATQTERAPDLVGADDRAHPILGPRLAASKPAELVRVKTASADDPLFREAIIDRALACSVMRGGYATVVAVVVNRVHRARDIFTHVREACGAEADVALLTGRGRAMDREILLDEVLPRMRLGNRQEGRPLFVVATQCVEAGADLDFDALVTELAPLDCLRQRFGRLNRSGRTGIVARAAIVSCAEHLGAHAEDPIYGRSPAATWAHLELHAQKTGKGKSARSEIDFGVEAASRWIPNDPIALAPMIAPRARAPVLLPAFLELWSRTRPEPTNDPDVSLFLHGPATGPADVTLVWRTELEDATDVDTATLRARLAACPPSALEGLQLPIWHARAFVSAAQPSPTLSDVDASPSQESRGRSRLALSCFRWAGRDDDRTERVRDANEIRPGDVIVVAATVGGCDAWGFNPGSRERVRDLGADANRAQRGRDILRVSAPFAVLAEAEHIGAELDGLRALSDREIKNGAAAELRLPAHWLTWLSEGRIEVVHRDDDGTVIALERRAISRTDDRGDAATTEDDASSYAALPVSLPEHSKGVASFAEAFARQAGLPPAVAADVALAGFLHDAGKGVPAFQCWLRGGDEIAAASETPLAKSGVERLPPAARARAKLPSDARHEVASLAFALAHPRFAEASDRELVLWLIGTHHGWGRPFFPPVEWPEPGSTFAVDLGDGVHTSSPAMRLDVLTGEWNELRARVTRRYGPWELARLEAILRLADHRRSQAEQEGA